MGNMCSGIKTLMNAKHKIKISNLVF